MQAMAPLLVFALVVPAQAQTSDAKDPVRRSTLDAALFLAFPRGTAVPIVLAFVPPETASPGVEAWMPFKDGKAEHVVVYAESKAFICASRQIPVHTGDYQCLRKLASIIVHEAWHFKNGPDEAGAYEAQIQFLVVQGSSEAEITGVRRARDRVLAREKRAGEEARRRYHDRPR